jgi:hypothetical protein
MKKNKLKSFDAKKVYDNISAKINKMSITRWRVERYLYVMAPSDSQLRIKNTNYIKFIPSHEPYLEAWVRHGNDASFHAEPYSYHIALERFKEDDLLCALIHDYFTKEFKENYFGRDTYKESAIHNFNSANNFVINKILSRQLTSNEYKGYVSGRIPLKDKEKIIPAGYSHANKIFRYYQSKKTAPDWFYGNLKRH